LSVNLVRDEDKYKITQNIHIYFMYFLGLLGSYIVPNKPFGSRETSKSSKTILLRRNGLFITTINKSFIGTKGILL
jgi:hypothetical protein